MSEFTGGQFISLSQLSDQPIDKIRDLIHYILREGMADNGPRMLPATVISMLFVLGLETACINIIGGIVCGVQLIPPLLSIIPTELALGRNFDKEGRRSKSGSRCANFWAAHRQNANCGYWNSCEKNKGRRESHESDRHSQAHRRPGPSSHPRRDPPHHAHPRGRPV